MLITVALCLGGMIGGGGCAPCHGADGRAGTLRTMSAAAIQAPDVTYDALVKSGKPLEAAMPRWQMSPADLGATIAYLKQLAAR